MKCRFGRAAVLALTLLLMNGCTSAKQETPQEQPDSDPVPAATASAATAESADGGETDTESEEETMLHIQIGDKTFTAAPADTEAADALMELLADGPMTIQGENYGGFEKVASLPQALPQQDSRITTQPGDIMLYQGDSIVFFYGSNTWAYTRLAAIRNASAEELKQAFGGSETSITLSR